MPQPRLNPEGLAAITTALAQHTAEIAAANKKLFGVIKAVPGGEDGVRALLGARGLTAAQIDGFFAGTVAPEDVAAVVNPAASRN